MIIGLKKWARSNLFKLLYLKIFFQIVGWERGIFIGVGNNCPSNNPKLDGDKYDFTYYI